MRRLPRLLRSLPGLALACLLAFTPGTMAHASEGTPLEGESTAPAPELTGSVAADPISTAEVGGEPVSPAPPASTPSFPTLRLRLDGMEHSPYISGYEDGSFQPDGEVTRAEAAQMLYRMLDGNYPQRAVLKDVPEGAWYADALELFAWCRIIDSPDGENIYPEERLTRREFITMLARLYPETEGANCDFPDVPEWVSWYGDVAKAVTLGWVGGYQDGCFHGGRPITRAEAVTILNRVLQRSPDRAWIEAEVPIPLFSDVTENYWAYGEIMEATLEHTVASLSTEGTEVWGTIEPLPAYPAGMLFVGNEQFYVDADGAPVRNQEINGLYYGPDGSYTSGDAEIDRYVLDILNQIITPDMGPEEKLQAAYLYVRETYSYLRRNYYEIGEVGWTLEEGRTMFQTGMGNCYCFASALYYLVRQLGFPAVAYSGVVGYDRSPHAWIEIEFNGIPYIYDAELDYAYRQKGIYYYNFYHVDYASIPWPYVK